MNKDEMMFCTTYTEMDKVNNVMYHVWNIRYGVKRIEDAYGMQRELIKSTLDSTTMKNVVYLEML